MKIALLIHVHNNPEQLKRLVSKLLHPEVDIYVNVDAKVNISEFSTVIKDVQYIKNRVEVRWGRFSQVQQILNSFQEIVDTQKNYSHILFISGADYPVQPIDNIVDFLNENCDKNYIDYHKLGDDEWSSLMKKRYEYWFFLPDTDIRNKPIVKKILQKLGFRRRYPFTEVYYGSCWFCLTTDVVKYLLDYVDQNNKTVDFFRYSGCSDELFIQSVLLNSPLETVFINKIYRYFDWSDNGKSPKILTAEDYPKILQTDDIWFARKLDQNTDDRLLDLLDKKIELDMKKR